MSDVLPIFRAEDTFVVSGRGRVFCGRWASPPDTYKVLSQMVLIEPAASNTTLREVLPKAQPFRIRGVERFAIMIEHPFKDGENVGLLV